MADLLLELFSEEIPARMQRMAEDHLANTLVSGLQKQGYTIDSAQVETFVTPRRVAVHLKSLPVAQADVIIERKGPRVDAPQEALDGFARSMGRLQIFSVLEKLGIIEKRDGFYFAKISQEGKPTKNVLEGLIKEILANFPWPKSMRWGDHDVRWVRPLHSILCLFDNEIIPIQFGPVVASNTTHGHRFLAPDVITISDTSTYEDALRKAFVIAKFNTRRAEIEEQVTTAASKHYYSVKPDSALLDEVTGLVEWPTVLMGSIDAPFMELPPEVLTTVMRSHQKYFSLLNKDGSLASHFLIVANRTTSDNGKAVIAGNERVLRARFSDGKFFWDLDRKKPLEQWARGLQDVTFHAKLGTIADKVERVKTLALSLAEYVKVDAKLVSRAADLSKADLVTGMVGEFAELQGIMGRYYALGKEDASVADAIRDHYKPQGPNDSVPTSPISICVALADKLDTLFRMFAIGEKPTGSKDPFALRRAALGIIRIILENNLRIPLKNLLENLPVQDIALRKAQEKLIQKTEAKLHDTPHKVGKYVTVNETAYEDLTTAVTPNLVLEILSFFADRLKVQLKDQGLRHDVIDAVMASGDDDLVRVVARAKALQEFLREDNGANLLAAYTRASNILKIEEKKDSKTYTSPVDSGLLTTPEEKALHKALTDTDTDVIQTVEKEDFAGAMAAMAALRAPVDAFFEKVLVNDKEPATRANRLKLLASIRSGMDRVANFAVVEG